MGSESLVPQAIDLNTGSDRYVKRPWKAEFSQTEELGLSTYSAVEIERVYNANDVGMFQFVIT